MIRTFQPAAVRAGLLSFLCFSASSSMPRAAAAQASLPSAVSASAPSTEAAALRAIVDQRSLPLMRWPKLDDVADDLRRIYDGAAWAPIWSREGRPTPASLAVIEQLAAADSRGLRAEDYDAATLRRLASAGMLRTPEERAAFDVAISAGAGRFVHALRYGRVSAKAAPMRSSRPSSTTARSRRRSPATARWRATPRWAA
jgi:hypothetical protein